MRLRVFAAVLSTLVGIGVAPIAQQPSAPRDTLPNDPQILDTATRGPSGRRIAGPKVRVVATKGLVYPNALAFLPDGSMLIAERAGRLRIVRDGVFDPQPVAGMPPVLDRNLKGLNDLALHPRFVENHLIYFTYYKPVAGSADMATAILARARFDGAHALRTCRRSSRRTRRPSDLRRRASSSAATARSIWRLASRFRPTDGRESRPPPTRSNQTVTSERCFG